MNFETIYFTFDIKKNLNYESDKKMRNKIVKQNFKKIENKEIAKQINSVKKMGNKEIIVEFFLRTNTVRIDSINVTDLWVIK